MTVLPKASSVNLTCVPNPPMILKTAYGDPSFATMLSMLTLRSSFSELGKPFVLTASGVPVVLVLLKKLPVPSSLIVPSPDKDDPPPVVATRLNVSEVSKIRSFVIATRTNNVGPVDGICTKLPTE